MLNPPINKKSYKNQYENNFLRIKGSSIPYKLHHALLFKCIVTFESIFNSLDYNFQKIHYKNIYECYNIIFQQKVWCIILGQNIWILDLFKESDIVQLLIFLNHIKNTWKKKTNFTEFLFLKHEITDVNIIKIPLLIV